MKTLQLVRENIHFTTFPTKLPDPEEISQTGNRFLAIPQVNRLADELSPKFVA